MHPPLAPARLCAAAFSLLFVPGVAHAHITLTDPPARHPAAELKDGPCGTGPGDSRTTDPTKITEYTAGATIIVSFTETIQHESHYRIMLSSTGDTGFVDPTGYEDTSLSPGELLDGEMDLEPGGFGVEEEWALEVTLPNEPCAECTLQLIQVMHDKPPFESGGDDIYYQCADIVIVAGPDTGSGGAASGTGGATGSGGTTGSGGASGGTAAGSGGSPVGSGGALGSGGGVPTGSGGAPSGAGGSPGSGGGGVVPPPMPASCTFQAGSGTSSGAGWLALAGLTWLALRKRRAVAARV